MSELHHKGNPITPFSDDQQIKIKKAAADFESQHGGSETMTGYVLRYVARFGVEPALQNLCNRWQIRTTTEGIADAFRHARKEAKELLSGLGVQQVGTGELQTGFYPGQPTDTHTVPRYDYVAHAEGEDLSKNAESTE